MKTNQLMMERSPSNQGAQAATAVKSILFAVHEDDSLEERLQAALALARACSAHLQLLQVVPVEAYTIVDPYGSTFVSAAMVDALKDEAAEVRNRLEQHLAKEDVSWSYDVTLSSAVPELVRNGALADILFIGRQPRWNEYGRSGPALLDALVCNARSPLCIPGDGRGRLDPFGKAVIAWNGSVEAANAVRASIGLLRMASDVRIIRYTEDKDNNFPDTRLLEYLSRHNIFAILDTRESRRNLADDLVEYARVFSAEYLVMGGYGHSRASEFVFGGVTRELLRRCPITLVMAH